MLNSSSRSSAGGKGDADAAAAGRRKASGDTATKRPSGGGVAPRKKSSLSVEALQSAAVAARENGQGGGGGGPKSPAGRRKRVGEGVAEEGGLTEEDLNAPITIGLCETPTIMLLEIRGSAVATDLRDFGRCVVITSKPFAISIAMPSCIVLQSTGTTMQCIGVENTNDYGTAVQAWYTSPALMYTAVVGAGERKILVERTSLTNVVCTLRQTAISCQWLTLLSG